MDKNKTALCPASQCYNDAILITVMHESLIVRQVLPSVAYLSWLLDLLSYSYSPICTGGAIGAFSLCVFTSSKLPPRGPPWNEGHRPRVRHETSVLEVPVQETTRTQFYSGSTSTFITCTLYTIMKVLHTTGRSRPPGEVGLTPKQYTGWNVVGHARSTGVPSQQGLLPEVPYCLYSQVCSPKRLNVEEPTNQKAPGPMPWWNI